MHYTMLTGNDLLAKVKELRDNGSIDFDPDFEAHLDSQASLKRDAARYRWLKAQTNLSLRTYRPTKPWTNVETGEEYYPTHYLDINGSGFGGLPTLDDLIDQAMGFYPGIPEHHS